MSNGRMRKYATPEAAAEAMRQYQAAYRAARKAGTWVRKNKVRKLKDPAAGGDPLFGDPRQIAKDAVTVLVKAGKIVDRHEAKVARIAAKERDREGRRQDWELADRELERRRKAAEKREKTRCERMTPEQRERERRLAAAARERQIRIAREKYGFDLYGEDSTPEEVAGRERYKADQAEQAREAARRRARKRTKIMLEFRAKRLSIEAARQAVEERLGAERAAALEEARRREIERVGRVREPRRNTKALHEALLAKYGFRVWKGTPDDPSLDAEAEARKRYAHDADAEYRERNRGKITAYNREYRRRKRAEALVKAQRTWTADEWAKWQARQDARKFGRGTSAWMVNEVVKLLAKEQGISTDDVMAKLLESGGVDFVMKGAEALGSKRAQVPSMVWAAARAVCLWLDPEQDILCAAGVR